MCEHVVPNLVCDNGGVLAGLTYFPQSADAMPMPRPVPRIRLPAGPCTIASPFTEDTDGQTAKKSAQNL